MGISKKLQTNETTAGVLRINHHIIVTSQSLQHDLLNKDAS